MNNRNFKKEIKREEILYNIKNKKCIFDMEHNRLKKKLPCGCHICNYLIEYLKSHDFHTSFRCKCSKKYNRIEMILLEILFEDINKDIENKIQAYFNLRFKSNCCICNNILNNKNENYIKYKMSIPKEKNNDLKTFVNRNKHYICDSCVRVIKLDYVFQCKICEVLHSIKN